MDEQDSGGPVPALRFPDFKNYGPWRPVTLGTLATPVTEKAGGGKNEYALTPSGGKGLVPQVDYFDKIVVGDNKARQVKITRDDFVHNDRTTKLPKFGSINRLKATEGGIVSPIYKCFRFNEGEHPEFWDYYFEASAHEAQVGSLLSERARTGRSNITINKLLSIKVWSPSQSEQERIGEFLSSIDSLIKTETEKLQALKDHKKGLMHRLFPSEGETLPRLRFRQFHNLGEWVHTELGLEAEKIGSGVTPKGGLTNYRNSGRPFVRSQNVGWGTLHLDDIAHIDEATHKNMLSTELIGNEVLLNITGAFIGRTAVADKRVVGGNVSQHVCIIRTTPQRLNPWFLNQYLLSKYGQAQISSCQAGGNRRGLDFRKVCSFIVPIPQHLKEQERVQDALRSADACILEQTKKVDVLQLYKQGLLQNIFPLLEEK